MLQFLKNFDPFRLLAVALIALLARFYWFSEDVLLIPSLQWLSIGEMMTDQKVLYKDIWTSLEPFSAGTYYFIDLLFGKSVAALRILSLLLCITQAFLFNYYVSQTNIYDQKTAYPAFFYVLFSSINYDFLSLSPVQLGLTFMLPVMYFLFKDVRMGEKSRNHFFAGASLGVASLFYLPFACFIVFVIYSFAVFSSFDFKRFFQLISAFAFPWLMVFSYYYLNGSLNEVMSNLIQSTFFSRPQYYVDFYSIVKVGLPSAALSIIAFFFTISKSKFLNFQYSSMKIMVMWFVNGLAAFLLMNEWGYFNLYIMVPVFSFFTVFLFLEIDRWWIKESLLWTLIITFVVLHIYYKSVDTEKMKAGKSSILISGDSEARFDGNVVAGKTILILGQDPEALIHNKQATLYASWNLALRHFGDLTNYANISFIYTNILDPKPEYIFDEVGIMPALIERIPELATYYEPSFDKKIYRLKK
ncbi:DUF6427 family protein [Cytophaga aurantiaca]|uniref:DUF6427 family protein n=1 Tax=Cytophaga aurantiaca TaxID=29530 RepID=UPI0003825DBE|nr:DUF6427 family protein [Cytophaga aurantiaca]